MQIQFYQTGRGDSPVQEYIDTLRDREQEQVRLALADIRLHGLRGRAALLRQIRVKLWEIKV